MRIFLLRFSSLHHLHQAFERVSDSEWVVSCLVEPGTRTLRFLADREPGEALVEEIHALGGLAWCSRHVPDEIGERIA